MRINVVIYIVAFTRGNCSCSGQEQDCRFSLGWQGVHTFIRKKKVRICRWKHFFQKSAIQLHIYFYRQLDFPSEPGVANNILEEKVQSEAEQLLRIWVIFG